MEQVFSHKNRILILNPPIEDFAAYSVWAAPLGLLRVAQALENTGRIVSYIDLLDHPGLHVCGAVPPRFKGDGRHSYWKTEIKKPRFFSSVSRKFFRFGATDREITEIFHGIEKPDIILIGSSMTYWAPLTIRTAMLAREIWPDIPLMTGGIAATLMPGYFIDQGLEVWQGLFPGTENIHLSLRLTKELSSYPLQLVQGCPNRCEYCASYLFSPRPLVRDLKNEAEALQEWGNATGKKDAAFFDDALLWKKGEYLKEFLSFLEPGQFRFHTPNGLHLHEIDMSVAVMLKKYCFSPLRFGFETIGARYGTKGGEIMLAEKLAVLRKAGFSKEECGVYIICGLPGQTVEEVIDTISFVDSAGGRPYLNEFAPVPGTALFAEHALEAGYPLEQEPLYHNNTISSLRSPVFTPPVIAHLKRILAQIYTPSGR